MTDAVKAPQIRGSCAAGFDQVRLAFEGNFTHRGEVGAALAVTLNGEIVVDLWAGWSDRDRRELWREHTLTNVWSATKAVTAVSAQQLVDRGELDLDAPVARYWPEFGTAGKADVPVRWLLSHRSGVTGVAVQHPLAVEDLYDWEKMTSLLAAQEPFFRPGTISGYQALSYGYLVGEVIRRITGQSVGAFLADNVSSPLKADFHLGLAIEDLDRCSVLLEPPADPEVETTLAKAFADAGPAALAALANPRPLGHHANADLWRQAEIPSANGHATARSLAIIYGALADGSERLMSASTLAVARQSQGRCVDVVAGVSGEFGLGYTLGSEERSFGPNPAAFGHDGFGGSSGFADPENGVGFGYVMNQMGPQLRDDPRKMALVQAVYDCLPAVGAGGGASGRG